MDNRIEKRRFKRMKADLTLQVSSLFNQDNKSVVNLDMPIKVVNVSKSGIGFESKSILPIDFYFNAALKLGSTPDTLSEASRLRAQIYSHMDANSLEWLLFLDTFLMNMSLRLGKSNFS